LNTFISIKEEQAILGHFQKVPLELREVLVGHVLETVSCPEEKLFIHRQLYKLFLKADLAPVIL
jgi:hypothetical protein